MKRKNLSLPFFLAFILLLCMPDIVRTQESEPEKMTPASELERELTEIEGNLTELEEKVEHLLEDFINPRISSIVLFFSSEEQSELVPITLEVRLDENPLITKDLSETDRLVLAKGGAIEIFSGTIEPVSHTLTVSYFLSDSQSRQSLDLNTRKKIFKIVPKRASTNYVEISLSKSKDTRKPSPILNARHWYKEP